MSDLVKSTENANQYNWGDGCSAWQLVNTSKFYVVEESMPPSSSEVEHHHEKCKQFFYVLSGKAVFTYNGKDIVVSTNQSIFIEPGIRHKVRNEGDTDLRMLIVSSPPSLNDRIE